MSIGPGLPPPSGQQAIQRYIPEDKAPISVQNIPVIAPWSVRNYGLTQSRRVHPVSLGVVGRMWPKVSLNYPATTLSYKRTTQRIVDNF